MTICQWVISALRYIGKPATVNDLTRATEWILSRFAHSTRRRTTKTAIAIIFKHPDRFGCAKIANRIWFHPLVGINSHETASVVYATGMRMLEMDANEIVEVKMSEIPEAGKGLFAKENIPGKSCILVYKGTVLSWLDYNLKAEYVGRDTDKYSVRSKYYVLDPTDHNGWIAEEEKVFAHYINHSKDRWNVAFFWHAGTPKDVVLHVWTARDIQAGEELLANYGYKCV